MEGGKEKRRSVNNVRPKKQHRNQQELLKVLFCLDTTADQQPASALEKHGSMKTSQIRFHRLPRFLPQHLRLVLLLESPPSSNCSDLCHPSPDPTLTSNRGNMKQCVDTGSCGWSISSQSTVCGCPQSLLPMEAHS